MKKLFVMAVLAFCLSAPAAAFEKPSNFGGAVPTSFSRNPNLVSESWWEGDHMVTVVYNRVTGQAVYMARVDSNGNIVWGWVAP